NVAACLQIADKYVLVAVRVIGHQIVGRAHERDKPTVGAQRVRGDRTQSVSSQRSCRHVSQGNELGCVCRCVANKHVVTLVVVVGGIITVETVEGDVASVGAEGWNGAGCIAGNAAVHVGADQFCRAVPHVAQINLVAPIGGVRDQVG